MFIEVGDNTGGTLDVFLVNSELPVWFASSSSMLLVNKKKNIQNKILPQAAQTGVYNY